MRILSTGEVGIGTSSPLHNLQVSSAGNAEIQTQRVGGAGVLIQSQAAVGVLGTNTNHRLDLKTNSVTYMTITPSGDVGIGLTAPTTKVDIGGMADPVVRIISDAGGDPQLRFDGSAANRSGMIKFYDNGAAAGGFIDYHHLGDKMNFGAGSVSTVTMTVTDGDVGIGTDSPDEKLHILDTTGANIILNSNAVAANSGIYMSEGADATPTQNGAYAYYDGTNNEFRIATGAAALADRLAIARDTGAVQLNEYGAGTFTGTATYDLSVDVNGNIIESPHGSGTITGSGTATRVAFFDTATSITSTSASATDLYWDNVNTHLGIGTDSPGSYNSAARQLVAVSAGDAGVSIIGGTASTSSVLFGDGTGGTAAYRGSIRYDHATDDLYIATGATEKMRILDTGEVGIGVTPTALLQVTGGKSGDWAGRFENTHATGYGVLAKIAGTTLSDLIFQARTGATNVMTVAGTGIVQFNTYGVGTHSGTATYDLSVDASGNIIETTGGGAGGPFVPYMSGTDQIARTEGAATYNTSLGFQALQLLAAGGVHNTMMGGRTGDSITTGDYNTAIGSNALKALSTGNKNTAVGTYALEALNVAGDGDNTAVGYYAGVAMTSGISNTLIGSDSGKALTSGSQNVAMGYLALSTEDTRGYNVAIGSYALQDLNSAADAYNVAIGYSAAKEMTSGTYNTVLGAQAMSVGITTGAKNTAIGYQAGLNITDGGNNVFSRL